MPQRDLNPEKGISGALILTKDVYRLKDEKVETILVMTNGGKKFPIPSKFYHSTFKEGPIQGGRDNVIWLTANPNDNFTLDRIKRGARIEQFDLTDENCPINLPKISVRTTNGYLDAESAKEYVEEGISAIYDPVKKWLAYFGHIETK